MKRLTYYYKTENYYDDPVVCHQFLLRCLPRMCASQNVLSASVLLLPDVGYTQQRDAFSNLLQIGHINEEHQYFSYTAIGEVEVDFSLKDTSPLHPMYRYPTVLTRMNASMRQFATPFADLPKTLDTVLQIAAAVNHQIEYTPESTDVHTGADDAFYAGRGVCQDYAHVLIALLRSLDIPARYACGLSVGEGVTHAWVQAYLDGGWVSVDPTRNTLTTEQYVTFAIGRDAADCPIDRGVYLGVSKHRQTVYMRLMEQ
ncbi:MAG TPA: transglutaminase family protein [Candidatus Limiplasma sp.]|nr:transglutaminase family protein [Candidatus Limiplasma sp.]